MYLLSDDQHLLWYQGGIRESPIIVSSLTNPLTSLFSEIGKASDVFKKGAVIGYDDEEIHVGDAVSSFYLIFNVFRLARYLRDPRWGYPWFAMG